MTTPRTTRIGRALRIVPAAALTLAAGALVLSWSRLVPLESWCTAVVLRVLFGAGTGSVDDVIWTGIGTDQMLGMRLTTLCSTVVLLVPLFLLGAGLLAWLRRSPAWRIGAGIVAALIVAVAANQLRLALLVGLWRWQGRAGFDLGHRYLGSIEVIILFALSMFLMVRIATGGRRTVAEPAQEIAA